jgi:hypothetical protein
MYTQIKQDSILFKKSHVKEIIRPLDNTQSQTKKNIQVDSNGKFFKIKNFNFEQILLKGKKDSSQRNNLIKTYSFEPWNNIISVNSRVYKAIFKQREIYIKNRNSEISYTSKIVQEFPHFSNENNDISNTILTLIITSFVLLAWVKISFGKYLNQLFRALINYSDEAKLYSDHNTMIDRLYLFLNTNFIIMGGLFIYYFLKHAGKEIFSMSPNILLISCLGTIICIYIYRYIINKIFGFVFYQKQVFNEYLHSAFIYYKAMGLFLLPIILLIYIVSEKYRIGLLTIGTIIIFLLYFINVFKATRIMLQKGILLFYWILYLCTVEFLPIILIYKYLSF